MELDKISSQFREYDRQKEKQRKEEKRASNESPAKSSVERFGQFYDTAYTYC